MNQTSHTQTLGAPLKLRCGAVIKNRFVKSAMSEALGTIDNRPTRKLPHLYETWAQGGTGLLVTGNVMIDKSALGEPLNVVIEDESELEMLGEWARRGTQNDTQLWMQLNHPGKQSPKGLSPEPVAPSAVPLAKGLRKLFNTPRALAEAEIENLIERFARAAGIAKKAGFTGVQIHGAHGYLVSEFLSPRHNQREDQWGGNPENRMRFAISIYQAIRETVGSEFPIGIKLNSADFQRGGFTEEESLNVIKTLDAAGIDLIEVSGGNYESPAMTGARQSTKEREAYFIEFAGKVNQQIDTTLLLTGGFRTSQGMADAIVSGATDLVGMARPLAMVTDIPNRILSGENFKSEVGPLSTGIKAIDKVSPLEVTWYEQQLALIAKGKQPNQNMHPGLSLVKTLLTTSLQTFARRRV
ncbi:MAG: NADH:flavin oxidoreductase/NADH oxidase family protein [Proteobacteria bacterium]|nr:NADH:flavin oxidoreductase/NADH oxidase family protein [Pseudomonadota bacterium]